DYYCAAWDYSLSGQVF
nr:immunoglobulin light chain junction region [Macaca mulatta]MOX43415.1 immunoglobulin light chain junction region [Macaca mulatta]